MAGWLAAEPDLLQPRNVVVVGIAFPCDRDRRRRGFHYYMMTHYSSSSSISYLVMLCRSMHKMSVGLSG